VKRLAVCAGLALLGFQFAPPVKLADGFDAATAGLVAADIDDDGRPEVVAWSARSIDVFRYGAKMPVECGLGGVHEVVSVSAGDFNSDGLQDLAILTKFDAQLWVNRRGRFEKLNIFLPEGAYNQALWMDYDHNGTLDLFLLGDKSALLENDGAGFTNVSNNFPFVQGRAVSGEVRGGDLVVRYSDRPGVHYVDKGGGRYEAQDAVVAKMPRVTALEFDYDGDGRTDRVEIRDGALVLLRRRAEPTK
jgi:hypothetical protein